MPAPPFVSKGGLLKHGDICEEKLYDKIPINYIISSVIEDYKKGNNFFIIEAATGSGKSFSLPVFFYKTFKPGNTLILQPKVLTVVQLKHDFTDKKGGITHYTNALTLGDDLSIKYGDLSVPCKNSHCLTVGSYGSFYKRLLKDPSYMDLFNVIILDEVHEEQMEILNLLLYLHYYDKKLPIVILTSATLNVDLIRKYYKLPITNYYSVRGNSHNKEINYDNSGTGITIPNTIVNILKKIIQTDSDKYDILIFVSTNMDIKNLKDDVNMKRLKELDKSVEIVGLSRKLITDNTSSDYDLFTKNDALLDPKNRKRQIVISTNSSETGVTFNMLKYVINVGYENRFEYIPYLHSNILYLSPISKDSETQRVGRVGRKFDGIAYNVYDKRASEALDKTRPSSLITAPLDEILLRRFNKINYIKKIPIELVYDALYNLVSLGFVEVEGDLYDSITYSDEMGYIIKGHVTDSGSKAKDILDRLDDDTTVNDVKLILTALYFRYSMKEVAIIISMKKYYPINEAIKNTDNDFVQLLLTYNKLISGKELVSGSRLNSNKIKTYNMDKVIFNIHSLLKTLYEIGVDIFTKNNSFTNTSDDNVYVIRKIFYFSYCNMLFRNGVYRGEYTGIKTDKWFITDGIEKKINRNKGIYTTKVKYTCTV